MAQQGSPPHRSGRAPASTRRGGNRAEDRFGWDADTYADPEEDYPPWAGPGVGPRWADQDERERRRRREVADDGPRTSRFVGDHRPRPGFRSRLAEARARRNRLMLYIWGGALVAVAIIATLVILQLGGHAAPKVSDGLVTTFQPGELKTVPTACSSVSAATLDKYLPGKRTGFAPKSLNGAAQSLCDWTLDAPPVYRHLQLTVQAYAPSGLASGNGSATFAAKDAYQQALQQKAKPPKATRLPKATVTPLPGLGSSAFAALQVITAGGDTTDEMTVVVRDHNVLVTVQLEGLAKSHTGRYGPVQVPVLQAGATAAARDVVSHLR